MNKKEIAEIKKLFTPSHCAITRICGCYVDAEKNIKTKLKEAFLSLEEEEMFKYFKIFKSTLSGTIGKNLLNMEFPLSQESEGGSQGCSQINAHAVGKGLSLSGKLLYYSDPWCLRCTGTRFG